MPDELEHRIEVDPAFGNATGRALARLSTVTLRRPDEPRDFVGEFPGWLTWLPPQIENFTHYHLRVDTDDGEPHYQFPPDQTAIQIFKGTRFFLSTFNRTNDLESGRVELEYDTESDFRIYSRSEEKVVVANYTMTTSSFPIPDTPFPEDGLLLFLFLAQDATGGRTPSWGSTFMNAPTTDIDPAASTLTVIMFRARRVAGSASGDSAWYYVTHSSGLATL